MGETDLISRQAAIEAIEQMQMPIMRSEFPEEKFVFTGMSEALQAIKDLPSAYPERCECCKTLSKTQLLIPQPEQRWIPCSERLPEESGEYLCTLVGVHNTGLPSECGYEPPNNHGITSGWSTCEADGFKFLRDDEVIAWMPLPEPWKGEDDERA